MIDKNMLEEFKNLTPFIKSNLYYFLAFRICYDYDPMISDRVALTVAKLAFECWGTDENNIDIETYANYILDAMYKYGGTIEQIEELDSNNIVMKYHEGATAKELLEFDVSKLEYSFTTIDNERYYLGEDGFYVVNNKGYKIKEFHNGNPIDGTFYLLEQNKIKHLSLNMHYKIRCKIINDINSDEENKAIYKVWMNEYKKYCKTHFITSKDIQKKGNDEVNVDLYDLDKQYTDDNKLAKLRESFQSIDRNNTENYVYALSTSNGTDYYYDVKDNKHYIAIDKHNVVKEMEDKPFFILNELRNNNKFAYISSQELQKIKEDLNLEYQSKDFKHKYGYNYNHKYSMKSLKALTDYLKDKEIDLFSRTIDLNMSILLRMSCYEVYLESIKHKKESKKVQQEKSKEI